MAIAPVPLFTETIQGQIDDLLLRICVALQLDETRYKLADDHYEAVGRWFEAEGSPIARYKPTIFPQGSMRLNTTVKPLEGDEYDLDFVCELSCTPRSFRSPIEALDLIESRLRQSDAYKSKLERKNRCVRLNYLHDFHMDILPGCRDLDAGGTCILVPDRKLHDWKASNPKGYAIWFESRGSLMRVNNNQVFAKAEPIPDQQAVGEKSPLQLGTQLLKRWRDLRYKSQQDVAPISVVLTTLAGYHYSGEQSTASALGSILKGISQSVRSSRPRLVVLNPSNPKEDLSERWTSDHVAYAEFVRGITEFEEQWNRLLQATGIANVTRMLEKLFGEEIAKQVVEKQAREIDAARSRNKLGVRKSSGVISGIASSASVAVRPNTFYGEK